MEREQEAQPRFANTVDPRRCATVRGGQMPDLMREDRPKLYRGRGDKRGKPEKEIAARGTERTKPHALLTSCTRLPGQQHLVDRRTV